MNKRILVVEDQACNRILVSTILNKMNYPHDLAENGKVALEMIEYIQYDLILMDIFMPVMDGFEALNKIKNHKNDFISKIPVIAMTANAESEGIEKFDAIFPKPLNIPLFEDVLKKWCGVSWVSLHKGT